MCHGSRVSMLNIRSSVTSGATACVTQQASRRASPACQAVQSRRQCRTLVSGGPKLGALHRLRYPLTTRQSTTSSRRLSSTPDKKDPQEGVGSKLINKWSALPLQEKATVAVAGVVTTLVGWKVLTFGVVLLERVLVGSLLAVEEVLVTSIIKGVSLVGGVGGIVLVMYATYYLVVGEERRR